MSKKKSGGGKYGIYREPKPSFFKRITGFFALLAFIIHFIFDVIGKLIDEGITKLCVFAGDRVKRCFLFTFRAVRGFAYSVYNVAADCVRGFVSTCNGIHDTLFSAVVRYDMFKAVVGRAWRKKKISAVPTAIKFTGKEIYNKRKAFASAFNVILPAVAIAVFAFTLNYWTTKEYGLVIFEENDGQAAVTVIKDEKVFEKASSLVAARLVHSSAADEKLDFVPNYKITAMDNIAFTSVENVSDLIIKKGSSDIVSATGLYADGELIGAMENKKELEKAVEALKNEALKKFSTKKSYSNAKAKVAQEVEYVDGLYPTETIYDGETFAKILRNEQYINTYYSAADGEEVSSIEKNTGFSVKTLSKLNPGLNLTDSIMLTGTKLITSSRPADLTVQITVDKTYNETIPYKTITTYDDDEHVDYHVVTQEGKNGSQVCVDTLTFENGRLINTVKGTRTVKKAPVPKKQIKGTIEYLYGHSYGNFIWPVPYTHNITSYFEMRWGRMHRGLDIAMSGCYGEDIIASDGGYVEVAEHVWDYGNYIIINHGNGVRTLYGHCSELYVSAGEAVYQGQPIAAIGETGEAYGAHLHFEIRINYGDNRVDPLDYL